jgi:hypothetical protein
MASRTIRGALLLGALLCLLAVLPAAAGAEVQTLTFDTAPPALGAPVDSFEAMSFPRELGFRPYRTDVGARAHSGTVVGDIGRCNDETPGIGCENFRANTVVRLAKTAEEVTLFAGEFNPAGSPPETAILTAFNAAGAFLAVDGPVPIDGNFRTKLSVKHTTTVGGAQVGDIASFKVIASTNTAGFGADLGIDDVTASLATGARQDFSIFTTGNVVPVIQGQSVDVPVQLPRLNGSSGPIGLSVSGLPDGVSAQVTPAGGVQGTEATATLTLTASPTAADTHGNLSDVTITATPGEPNVGPAPRSTTLSVRVGTSFGLSVNGLSDTNRPENIKVPIEVPDCAPVDLPLKVSRDIAFNQNIALSLREDQVGAIGLPVGVSAEILPQATVLPGGNVVAERTLRFKADPSANLSQNEFPIALEGTSGSGAGTQTRVLPMHMSRATPRATVASGEPGSGLGLTPRFLGEGTPIRIHGTGFCPGTEVLVGNARATAPATFVNDHTIEFRVPRFATTGPVTIIPPGKLPNYRTADTLAIDNVRNTDGFSFKNFDFGTLGLTELTEAFGSDDLFFNINPCWPFGDCKVTTGILNPIAAIDWGVLNVALSSTNGHCIGMTLGSQRLITGKDRYSRFATSATPHGHPTVFDIPGPAGPMGEDLNSYLDAMQARQASEEFFREKFRRPKSLQAQIDVIARELSADRKPMVTFESDRSAHAFLAYDMVQTPDSAEIYVYDNNRPYKEGEDFDSGLHVKELTGSIVHIDKKNGTWSYPSLDGADFTGGNDGTLWAVPPSAFPEDPSLPGLHTINEALASSLSSMLFGSVDGSVKTASGSAGAELQPMLGGGPATPGDSGTWVMRDSRKPLDVTFEGTKAGHYTQAYTAPGFIAGASDMATAKGVRDTVRGVDDSLRIDSGESRPLEIELARESSQVRTTAATLDTHASADGSDTAGFSDGGALTYAHDGAPTTLSFSLTSVRRNGGPSTFLSGPVAIGRGDRLSARPMDRDLRRVRVTVRDAHGGTTTRVLGNRDRGAGRLKLGAPKLSGRRLSVRVRLSGVQGKAIAGAVLRLMRGKHVVAHKALSLKNAGGSHRIVWKLPRSAKKGAYRLLTDVRAVTVGARGSTATDSVSAHRATQVSLRR